MTRKERLVFSIDSAVKQLIDEIERLESYLDDANEAIDTLKDEINTLTARIQELEEAQS